MRDKKETIRWASTSKPAFGGISFYIVFLFSFIFHSVFFESQDILWNKKIAGILGAATLAFMMGLADDAYNTKPFLKLLAQLICGIILCYSGIYISIFDNILINYLITILWVVAIMNSLNMLDNMDAIASIVSIFILLSAALLAIASGNAHPVHLIILSGIIGALLGFLFFNWHPSKLFMGDTGSQFIGLMIASIGIMYFWNTPFESTVAIIPSKQILIVLTAFILPIADTTTVVINRIMQGGSPFVGGRDHTTHNLFYRGLTEKRIAILFGGIGAASLCLVYFMETQITSWGINEFVLFSVFPFAVLAFLFAFTKIKNINFSRPASKVKTTANHAETRLS